MTHNELLTRYAAGERDFHEANLRGANLIGSDLREANLIGSDLCGANLSGADLRRADLRGVNLSGADLRGADLRGADLSRANLSGANLSRANLIWANLGGANLIWANLGGANLSEAKNIKCADCSWFGHGERGRRLLAVEIAGGLVFFCGCFRGGVDDLRKYIVDGEEKYRASRMRALEFVLGCFEEVAE